MAKKKEVKTYTKGEFVDLVAKKTGATKTDSNKALDAVIESLTEVLKAGDAVSFIGFGKFSVGERAARDGRNPQTGKTIKIPASKVAKFTAGQGLKDAVNGK
jgi:nucleoid DNA-binding protein